MKFRDYCFFLGITMVIASWLKKIDGGQVHEYSAIIAAFLIFSPMAFTVWKEVAEWSKNLNTPKE